MLNKFYGRGVCDALQEVGLVKFANEEIANEAADAISDAVLPEEVPEDIGPETTAALADNLMELSQALNAGADHAAAAAEEAAKTGSAYPARSARIKSAARWLRNKMAEGTTITGNDPEQQNKEQNSDTGEARMDEQNRPGGSSYANVGEDGVGTQQASGEGAIGSEKDHPVSGGPVDVQNTNSAIEAIKGASLQRLLTKMSMGTTLMPGAAPTPDAQTGEGDLNDANRPGGMGYANQGMAGVGKSTEAAKERDASVGKETAHPGTMGPVGKGGTNSAIQQIPGSKSAADQAYLKNFQAVANKYAAYLPPRLSQAEKVAAIKYLLSQEPIVRDRLALRMQKTAEMPEGLAEYVAKEKGEEKEEGEEEEKKEEKAEGKEEEKTSSASDVLAKVRRLIANA